MSKARISKILIANRGEIAVRVIRTARRMGYSTVAVFSDADADALHVRMADEAIRLGPSPVSESYIVIDKVIDAARRSGADAIHPGYGFLSENAQFADACERAGLAFIGPPVAAIHLMGSKRLSKIAMIEAGVPCIPGYEGEDQSDEKLLAVGREIGVPLMVKASAGGGGKGMRLVHEIADLAEGIARARSEAKNAFGSDELILERALIEPRHVEIQVFADSHGNVVHLGERDCSIQRRHQKVIEESPSPAVDEDLRQRMGAAAVAAAASCGYRGAGTVEFLLDRTGAFYFLEMNTRLQVEHPVTEMVTGLDLVEWQIRVADGETLPLTQDQITLTGHAVEARLYAEDPRKDFAPQTGVITEWGVPQREGIRVDTGIAAGQAVSSFYDPMIAKVIAHGPDRATAVRRLAAALEETRLFGIATNRSFLVGLLRHPVFAAGEATTYFIGQHFFEHPSMGAAQDDPLGWALAAALLSNGTGLQDHIWRGGTRQSSRFVLSTGNDERRTLDVSCDAHPGIVVRSGNSSTRFTLRETAPGSGSFEIDGHRRRLSWSRTALGVTIDYGSGEQSYRDHSLDAPETVSKGSGRLVAPMEGAIIAIHRQPGDRVSVGDPIAAMEAMKMETQIVADVAGEVVEIAVAIGDQVKNRQIIAVIIPID